MRDILQEMRVAKDALESWRKYLSKHDDSDYTQFDKSADLEAARAIIKAYKALLEVLGKHVNQEWRN